MTRENERAPWALTATGVGERFADGSITSEKLVEALLLRVENLDVGEGGLHSLTEWNPDALAIARALDRERREAGPRGPLHGIPVVLKDNIATADGMHTTAGAMVLQDLVSPIEASLVERLRRAGLVILGKANLTEWANWISDHMPNGFSYLGRQTLNPYGPGRFDTGGSSAGSAVSVSAGLTPLSVGTETSGSILSPASQNGVVGIKPTVGLISRYGIIPISPSQDTAGPIARTVEDAALLLDVLAGPDPRDPATLAHPTQVSDGTYARAAREGTLKGRSVGIPREPYWENLRPDRRKAVESVLAILQAHGLRVVDPVTVPSAGRPWGLEILRYEFKAALGRFLREMGEAVSVRGLDEIIRFNERHPEAIPYGQDIFLKSEDTSGRFMDPLYLKARRQYQRWARGEGIDAALDGTGLDALVFVNASGAYLGATAGYPSVTLPVATTPEGEPIGLTLTGRAFDEKRLIEMAGALERILLADGRGRTEPGLAS